MFAFRKDAIDWNMKPTETCNHLTYGWFDKGKGVDIARTVLYFVTLLLFFTALPGVWWGTMTTLFLVGYVIIKYMYPCATASTWCWSVVFSSIAILLVSVLERKVFV